MFAAAAASAAWQRSELSAGRCNFQQVDAAALTDDARLSDEKEWEMVAAEAGEEVSI